MNKLNIKSKYFVIFLAGFLLIQPGFSAFATMFYSSYDEGSNYLPSSYDTNYSSPSTADYSWSYSPSSYDSYSSPSYAATDYYTPVYTTSDWSFWGQSSYDNNYSSPSYAATDYYTPTYTYPTYSYTYPTYSYNYQCTSPCSSYSYYDGYYYYCSDPCYYFPPTCASSCCGSSCPTQPTYQTLTVSCSASPNPVPVNQNVNFNAYASGGSGSYTYSWSGNCNWGWGSNNCSTSYSSAGTYTATVTVTSGNQTASANCLVNVQGAPALSINKLVRNITDGTGWQDSVSADPNDRLEFSLQVTSNGNTVANNVRVSDSLPYKMNDQGNVKIDGNYSGGDIASGINIGSLSQGQSKTITFEVSVSSESDFSYGTTTLTNYGRVSADNVNQINDTALVNVYRDYVHHSPGLSINKLVRNITDGTGWQESVSADPNDQLSFSLQVTSNGTTDATNTQIQDILPSQIIYQGNVKIDGYYNGGNITSGINIGTLVVGQSKTITFDVQVTSASNFSGYGSISLTNTARVWADGISYIQDTAVINVYQNYIPVPTPTNFSVSKLVRNLSDGTSWQEVVAADPGELVSFSIQITAGSGGTAQNVVVKDTLPLKVTYQGNLKVDNVASSGDIINGLNIGTLSSGQIKTITFDAIVSGTSQFVYGTTELINTALAYNTNYSTSDTAKITVTKATVAGAITEIPTGVNPLYLALIIAFIFSLGFYFLLPYIEDSQNPFIRKALGTGYKVKAFLFR